MGTEIIIILHNFYNALYINLLILEEAVKWTEGLIIYKFNSVNSLIK